MNQIRDYLISKGFNNAISFDGSSSSTLLSDNSAVAIPADYKNNAIPTGATFVGTSEPKTSKKTKKKKR